MTGRRIPLKGYRMKDGKLVPIPTANLPRNVAVQRSKAKQKYAPIPSYEVKK
jgi:hypothetical protein